MSAPLITAPGIHDIGEAAYHADPCPAPSLSRGIAQLLIRKSPMHAHFAHPRLGGGDDPDVTTIMDDGSAIHTLFLGKGSRVVPLATTYGPKHKKAGQPVTDFKTETATEERDAIRADGGIPVLAGQHPVLVRAAEIAREYLRMHQDGADFFEPGRSEAVVAWQEDGFWLRCMIDRLPDDPRAPPYDVKVTAMDATAGSWERRLRDVYAFQDAFYRRGLRAVRGVTPPPMRFVVIEREPPHGVSVMACAPSLVMLAEQQVDRAIRAWKHCLATDNWPGYPPFTAHVEAKPWQLEAEDAAATREEIMETLS